MKVLTKIDDIDHGWRGTCCETLLSDKSFNDYFKFISSKNALDPKNRFHYYIKSFIVPYMVSNIGIKNVFHIGFGEGKRYPISYEYFNTNFFGCELPENENQSWFKSNNVTKNILLKNFLDWSDQDFSLFSEIDRSNLIVISEATFYYFLLKNKDYNNRHVAKNNTEELKLQLKKVINSFVRQGITKFMFVEPNDSLFETVAKENNLHYRRLQFNEQFKYDFLLDYKYFRESSEYFANIHIISNNDFSSKLKNIAY